MRRALALAGIAALLVSGCASRASVTSLGTDLDTLRQEVAALRSADDRLTLEMGRAVTDLKELERELQALDRRIGSASAEVQELRAKIAAADKELRQVRTDLDARPAAVPPPPPRRPAPAPATAERQAANDARTAEAMYESALTQFRAHELGQAVLEFLDFLAKYPKHTLAANAQYWIGEAYYAEHDYRQALVEFEKVLDHNPEHAKAPDALFKIGLSHQRLRETARAESTWRRLIHEYPESGTAARARTLLRRGAGAR